MKLLILLALLSSSLSLKRSKEIHFSSTLYFLPDGYDTVHKTTKIKGISFKWYDKDGIMLEIEEGKEVPKELENYIEKDGNSKIIYRLPYFVIKEIMEKDEGREVKNLLKMEKKFKNW